MAPIDEALEFLKLCDTVNYAKTARQFNCDETTLRRRHQGKQRSRRDADSLYKSRLSKQQERDLVAYIRKLSSRGIPPTLPMIKSFAQDIAKIEVGKDWPYSFVRPPSGVFTTSETGWTNHELGKEWLIGVFDRFTKEKARNGRDYRLLITDGHSSHVNMDFLEWCDQHRIIVAVFPPHSTHRLQPLMCPFGPLSTAYTNQLIQWTAKTQGLIGLSKREFWSLFWNAFGSSFSAENIASGWKRTGLLPFDPEVVLSQIAEKTEDESESGDSSVDSLALQQPTARDLRRLVDKVVDGSSKTLAETVGSSKYSRKSPISERIASI
ncbi:DDE superfamily endonuclease domain-containing protein [Hirsutella rhossiliensis]|uniref:DDE superfamily endonuclease domain-containing protein n=1 Tax=Hirsutella rhossiliensis TaxID=111463 RepID=A0A9P8SBU9_9HYPO|nr:DDE superfamily endonuclease domain-containing protein [Hirsutella rhossiliensis]KAH0956896.1 DDE superfamily endonuclease domain-containing protein [Hirsutella rhossiliensis]